MQFIKSIFPCLYISKYNKSYYILDYVSINYKGSFFKKNACLYSECEICLEGIEANIIFDTCGHKVCKKCFAQISNPCCFCREPIIRSYKIPKHFYTYKTRNVL